MKIEIPSRKLENTILDLNAKGYTVKKSVIDGDNIILTAKKTKVCVFPDLTREIVSEEKKEIISYPKRNAMFDSLWRGFKVSWLNIYT